MEFQSLLFDSGNSYQGIQCTCMTNNTEAAAMGAEKLCEAIGESGEVALIVPDSVSGNAKDRVSAFNRRYQKIIRGYRLWRRYTWIRSMN